MSLEKIIELIEVITCPLMAIIIVLWLRVELRLMVKVLAKRISEGAGFKTPFLSIEERKCSEIGRDFLVLFESSETIVIDSTPLLGKTNGKRFSESLSANMPVWVFIHKVRIQLEPYVQPYSYSKEWYLESDDQSKRFCDIGVNRPETKGDKFDSRTLQEVGIFGYKELKVVKVNMVT